MTDNKKSNSNKGQKTGSFDVNKGATKIPSNKKSCGALKLPNDKKKK